MLNVGNLRLLRIDRHTSVTVLDKIVKYEAVHRIQGSRDLERRLAEDRRCYAFVHPALPDEPLIFTELALTHDMSADARVLLDAESPIADPSTCTCAIFFSISSCHEGLKGVSLGNALIGQVADELQSVYPRLDTFATLSPVPGFRAWLMNLAPAGTGGPLSANAALALGRLERSERPGEVECPTNSKRELLSLCAYYLLRVKRGGEPADPVARFHLRNGACLERINWLGDTSVAGMRPGGGADGQLPVSSQQPAVPVQRCHAPARRECVAPGGTAGRRGLDSALPGIRDRRSLDSLLPHVPLLAAGILDRIPARFVSPPRL